MASAEHKELASFIKGVHRTLRVQSHAVGAEKAWQEHCQQTQVLQMYAEKMQLLATEFWHKNNSEDSNACRIQWVVKQCMEYFYEEGYIKAALKEEKMSQKYVGVTTNKFETIDPKYVLRLLDVGSCYNPFSKFNLFEVTAIDIMPATSDVIKCDFLSVNISSIDKPISNPCLVLPVMYFDVVVFSLLLEYFPSSNQRFKCCTKAFEVLKPGGLLFILTPDSKHASANSKMMKSWRYALSSLGFWRISFQKLKHLHCMAYRRCFNTEIPKHWLSLQNCEENPKDLLCIPQDFHEYCDNSNNDDSVIERCDMDNKLLAENFSNFPDTDIFL